MALLHMSPNLTAFDLGNVRLGYVEGLRDFGLGAKRCAYESYLFFGKFGSWVGNARRAVPMCILWDFVVGQMLPKTTGTDSANHSLRDTVTLSYSVLRFVSKSYRYGISLCKFCHSVVASLWRPKLLRMKNRAISSTACLASFRVTVDGIIEVRPEKEMFGIAARRVIAMVADHEMRWDSSVFDDVGKPVGSASVSTLAWPITHHAVSANEQKPRPTFIWSANSNAGIEPFLGWNWEVLAHVRQYSTLVRA